jgi:lipopolysaccharide transport system ATP-binding protein
VSAHLQPEILVVDEVLAVGDASFQKKCLGKMATVASGGRTVLFVSHNMAAVSRLGRSGSDRKSIVVAAPLRLS